MYSFHPAQPIIIEHVISMVTKQKIKIKCKLFSIHKKLDITEWMLLKIFLTQSNWLMILQFCVNLKYETKFSICKQTVAVGKGDNSKMWQGRIST
jgi:hypothetical protein